ncbi:MAG TPA: hypothetical protein VMD75_09815 [Candidatus Binataceae bacterium]|nr:hypothetical protein [Candidatus Binataceae bacterium]
MPPSELTVFQRHLQKLDYTRKRMEDLFQEGKISKRDVCSVYEALFLRAVTRFETFLEDLFLAILQKRVKYNKSRKILPRIVHRSNDALTRVVYREQPYLDWMPFKETQQRADLFLYGGRPFSELELDHKDVMTRIWVTRNAIAHDSQHVKRQFHKTIVKSLVLRPTEKSPAGFLRSQVNPTTNRFEVYVGELGRIAAHLCSPTRPARKFP